MIPNITELSTYKSEVTTLNVDALKALIDNKKIYLHGQLQQLQHMEMLIMQVSKYLKVSMLHKQLLIMPLEQLIRQLKNKVLKGDLSKLK